MPLAPVVLASIIGGGASIAGGALANKSKQSSTSTPTLDPKFSGMQDVLMQSIMSRLRGDANGSSLPPAYETGGIRDINRTYDLAGQHSANDLTSRGLGSSPIAGHVDAMNNGARAGSIADFKGGLPLINQQLQNQDMGFAAQFLNQGRGTSQTSTGSNGGGAAGAFGDLGSFLGFLIGKGAFGKQGGSAGGGAYSGANPGGWDPWGSN